MATRKPGMWERLLQLEVAIKKENLMPPDSEEYFPLILGHMDILELSKDTRMLFFINEPGLIQLDGFYARVRIFNIYDGLLFDQAAHRHWSRPPKLPEIEKHLDILWDLRAQAARQVVYEPAA